MMPNLEELSLHFNEDTFEFEVFCSPSEGPRFTMTIKEFKAAYPYYWGEFEALYLKMVMNVCHNKKYTIKL